MSLWILSEESKSAFPADLIVELNVVAQFTPGSGDTGAPIGFRVQASLTPLRPGRFVPLAEFGPDDQAAALDARLQLVYLLAEYDPAEDGPKVLQWAGEWVEHQLGDTPIVED